MPLRAINSDHDYRAALNRIDTLFDATGGSPEGDELQVLAILVDEYESRVHPIEAPDPIEAIRFRMDQEGLTAKDLERLIGYKGRVSEILSRKRKLSLGMIRKLEAGLQIPASVLIQEY